MLLRQDMMRADTRTGEVAMIFQDPMTALNPVLHGRRQIAEVFRLACTTLSHEGCAPRAVELLGLVGIPQPARGQSVSARVLRRHAPAGDDRHGDRLRPDC